MSPLIDLRSFREVTEMHSFVYISKLNRVWCNKWLVSLTNKSLLNDEAFSFNKSPDLTSDDERWLSTVLNAASGSTNVICVFLLFFSFNL